MSENEDRAIERRFQRNTYLVIAILFFAGLQFSGRRMALGVMLGGVLSLFNKRWLQGSVRAILSYAAMTQTGRVPIFTSSKLILRYLVVGAVILAAVRTGEFHPAGIGFGFAAFVGGVMIEAGYQLYLSFQSASEEENSTEE
ncbi:MAG: ATP synthase subunit I [Blastocatellia bacterium]|nr:ATP synthase subunit I [Blastocatellia bacterium]